MKKMILLSHLLCLPIGLLSAADGGGDNFVEIARNHCPAFCTLYLAAQIGKDEFLAVYEPTPEGVRIEEGKSYYELFQAKIGSRDKLEAVSVKIERSRGSGEEIFFKDKTLYIPGCPHNRPMFLPVDPEDGPALLRDKLWELDLNPAAEKELGLWLDSLDEAAFYDALYEKLPVTVFNIKDKQ